jgi:hypothetical protein
MINNSFCILNEFKSDTPALYHARGIDLRVLGSRRPTAPGIVSLQIAFCRDEPLIACSVSVACDEEIIVGLDVD